MPIKGISLGNGSNSLYTQALNDAYKKRLLATTQATAVPQINGSGNQTPQLAACPPAPEGCGGSLDIQA